MIDAKELFESMLATYAGLGKTGKPQPHEHTTLAGVAVSFESDKRVVILALATGTKCLPATARQVDGIAVHDSHAEALARRTAVRWIMDEMYALCEGKHSAVLEKGRADGQARLRQGVEFHLVVSSAPCGDCAILDGRDDHIGGDGGIGDEQLAGNKRQRTGAKAVNIPSVLPGQADVETSVQRVGVVRRKPGKGSPTSSTSCSDKILRWMHLGFQGCLLRSLLEEPLYFSSITAVCASGVALKRGAWGRQPVSGREPPVFRSLSSLDKVLDEHGLRSSSTRTVGAGFCVSWWGRRSHAWNSSATHDGIFSEVPKASKQHREVLIGKLGFKAGANCKSGEAPPPQFHSRLCRRSMRMHFGSLARQMGQNIGQKEESLTHEEFKLEVCPEYVHHWMDLKEHCVLFRNWLAKA